MSTQNFEHTRTQFRGEETRTHILAAAEDLFAQKGYDATGINDICQAAGVSKGALYHHFASKQAVFQALLDGWLAQLDSQMQAVFSDSTSIPQGLLTMAGNTRAIFEAANTRSPIFLEFWMQALRQPEIWQTVIAPYQRYVNIFTGLIHQGQQEGSLDPGIDAEVASRTITAFALGMLLQAFFDPNDADWSRVTQQGIELLMVGMQRKNS